MPKKQKSKFSWFIFLLMFPMITPEVFFSLPESVLTWIPRWQVASTGIVSFLAVRKLIARKKIPMYFFLFGALTIWILAMAFFQSHQALEYMMCYGIPIGFYALLVYCFLDDPLSITATVAVNFEWIIAGYLISWFLSLCGCGAMNSGTSFIGNRNAVSFFALSVICCAMFNLKSNCKFDRYNAAACIVLGATAVLIGKSSTGFVALAAIPAVFLLSQKILNIWSVWLLTLAADVLLVVMRIADKNPLVAGIIQNVFHKNITFSLRTYIWDAFVGKLMPEHWLTGVGFSSTGNIRTEIPDGRVIMYGTHNAYYEIISEGGIIALILFLAVIVFICMELYKNRDTYAGRVMTAVMAGLFVEMIFENFPHYPYFLMILACCAGEIAKGINPDFSGVERVSDQQ